MNISRRQLVLAGAATASVVAVGAGYALWRAGIFGGGAADLMLPGPLGEQAMGSDNAPVTIIEYASLTCSHCADFDINTFPVLKERYIDTGKVRFIFREFPFDPIATGAFMLARCAGKDKFFAVVDLLFHTQRTWAVERPLEPLLATVKQAGFTEETFKACLADQKVLSGVEWVRDRAAESFKVNSTPTFFINGKMQVGAVSIDELERLMKP